MELLKLLKRVSSRLGRHLLDGLHDCGPRQLSNFWALAGFMQWPDVRTVDKIHIGLPQRLDLLLPCRIPCVSCVDPREQHDGDAGRAERLTHLRQGLVVGDAGRELGDVVRTCWGHDIAVCNRVRARLSWQAGVSRTGRPVSTPSRSSSPFALSQRPAFGVRVTAICHPRVIAGSTRPVRSCSTPSAAVPTTPSTPRLPAFTVPPPRIGPSPRPAVQQYSREVPQPQRLSATPAVPKGCPVTDLWHESGWPGLAPGSHPLEGTSLGSPLRPHDTAADGRGPVPPGNVRTHPPGEMSRAPVMVRRCQRSSSSK